MADENISIDDGLLKCADHQLLCTYVETIPLSDGAQIQLQPISEEPEFVLHHPEVFHDSNSVIYSTRSRDYHFPAGKRALISAPYEEVNEYFDQELKGKILRVQPYYYFSNKYGAYYRNCLILTHENYDIKKNIDLSDKEFFTIPSITEDNYQNMINGEKFFLPKWDYTLFGIPHYLFRNPYIISVDLEPSDTSTVTYSLKKDSTYFPIKVSVSKMKEEGNCLFPFNTLSMTERTDHVFFEKSALLAAFRQAQLAKAQLAVPEKESENLSAPLAEVAAAEKTTLSSAEPEKENDLLYQNSDETKYLNAFHDYALKKNLVYQQNDINNFHTCLKTRALTILAGMTGTGKTRLPLTYAEYFHLSEEKGTLLFVPISPGYTEPSDILGFYNPIAQEYVPSATGLVEFLLHAQKYPNKMHMVVFDEMNLSPIELYFAPFLSLLERDPEERILHLYDSNAVHGKKVSDLPIPPTVKLGTNIVFVGTINLDETTNALSDRLLDRSFVLSLDKGSFQQLQAMETGDSQITVEDFPKDTDLLSLIDNRKEETKKPYITAFQTKEIEFLDELDTKLHQADSQKCVSYRSVRNISLYLRSAPTEMRRATAFDYALRQTVLKKLNGSRDSLGSLLGTLNDNGELFNSVIGDLFKKYENISEFLLCKEEIRNKIRELEQYGYTR